LLEFFRSCWLDGTGVDFSDPQINLLAADLSGLPRVPEVDQAIAAMGGWLRLALGLESAVA
jgi:hypothetical protein